MLCCFVNSNCLDFYKDVSTSPDATIPEIVKEIKEKQADISLEPPTKTEVLPGLRTIRNYLTSISETQLILITIHCIISKREL